MTDLRRHLRAADPLRQESALPADRIDRMRKAVLAAAREPRPRLSASAFALLASLTTAAAAGVWFVGGATPTPRTPPTASVVPNVSAPAETHRRQVHFATPGGTRLIWVFNPQLEVR